MSSDTPSVGGVLLTPAANIQQRTDLPLLSPSARTSFTRVDICSEGEEDNGGADETADDAVEAEGIPAVEPAVPQAAQVFLTFLTVSGRRRTMSFEAEAMIGKVKELVWNTWPNGKLLPHLYWFVKRKCCSS